jgi:hypothetical protein
MAAGLVAAGAVAAAFAVRRDRDLSPLLGAVAVGTALAEVVRGRRRRARQT